MVDYDGNDVGEFTIPSTSSATETTMACLKRIQQALDQFEASEETLKSSRQIAVSIEVYKHILDADIQAGKRKRWEVAHIRRQYDTAFGGGHADEFPDAALGGGHADEFPHSGDRRYKPVVQVGAVQGLSNENFLDKTKTMLGLGPKRPELHPTPTRLGAGISTEPEEDEQYDPYIASGVPFSPLAGDVGGNQRTAALQVQIDDTGGAMHDNISKVSQRGEKLASLGDEIGKQSEADLVIARRNSPGGLVEQKEIDETFRVMRQNIEKVQQRGERLDSLQDKTDNLSLSAQGFRRGANTARKQQGWLSTLNTAWENLPSAKEAVASTDKFFQE